jgi:hypothetical protein
MPEHLVRNKSCALRIDGTVAEAALAVRVEALLHHQTGRYGSV